MTHIRPVVSVYKPDGTKTTTRITTPAVFSTDVRPDIIRFVHSCLNKNHRQAHAISPNSGYQHSAESWGTGRAVARIPRVSASGTGAGASGAFGNMCRGGGMFAPLKVWRRIHRKVNVTLKRHAMASAIAATASPSLAAARGHRVEHVPEFPLVVSDDLQSISKTSQAVKCLESLGAGADLAKVRDTIQTRSGRGKSRNRPTTSRVGPLVIYANDDGCTKAFRNIPGVDMCCVDALNVLSLAPGSHAGRFVLWTESAFAKLAQLYGNGNSPAALKSGYVLPRSVLNNSDISRVINSEEIQSKLRPVLCSTPKRTQFLNPLKNKVFRSSLNPLCA